MVTFPLPDLADFPDYENEPRWTEHEPVEEYQAMKKAIEDKDTDSFFSAFHKFYLPKLHSLTKKQQSDAAGWYHRLQGYFEFYKTHRKPEFHVEQLRKGLYQTNIDANSITSKITHLVDKLRAIDDWRPPCGTFDRVTTVTPFLGGYLNSMFQEAGILDIASNYLRRPVKVDHVVLHLSRPGDNYHKQFFYDAVTTPKWTMAHIDPKEDTVKSIVYLKPTGENNGAFKYVRSSNQFKLHPLQSLFGRSISTGSYCPTPDHRASVFQLPPLLRTSVNFGRMAIPGTWLDKFLEEHMTTHGSDEGNTIVFDPNGIHQGGICHGAERLALQVLMR